MVSPLLLTFTAESHLTHISSNLALSSCQAKHGCWGQARDRAASTVRIDRRTGAGQPLETAEPNLLHCSPATMARGRVRFHKLANSSHYSGPQLLWVSRAWEGGVRNTSTFPQTVTNYISVSANEKREFTFCQVLWKKGPTGELRVEWGTDPLWHRNSLGETDCSLHERGLIILWKTAFDSPCRALPIT